MLKLPNGRNVFHKRRISLMSALMAFSALVTTSATAQHVYFDPRAEVRVTATDNANLTETDKVFDGALNTAVGLNMRIDGTRIRAAVDYSLDHFLFFSDFGEEYRQNLFGTLDAEVIKDHFNLIGRASLRQQFLDQRGALSGSAANRTSNRRLVQSYTTTAILKGGIVDFADFRLSYRLGIQESPADNLDDDTLPINFSDSITHDVLASISSGTRFRGFQWRLFASSSRITRSLDVNDFRNERAGAEATIVLNRYLQLIGNVNYSANDFQSAVLSEDGFGWEAGFRWTPGQKLDLSLRYGREGNREVWYAALQHFFSVRLDFNGTYTDTITANNIVTNDNLGSLQFNPEGGIFNGQQRPIDETDPNFSFSDVDFRRRSATGTFTLRGRRTEYFLSGFYEWRTFDDGTGTGRARGLSIGFDHDINEKTQLSSRLSFRQSLFEDGVRVDDFITGNLTWSRSLARNLQFNISYDHSNRLSNVDGQNLQENALTVYLRGIF